MASREPAEWLLGFTLLLSVRTPIMWGVSVKIWSQNDIRVSYQLSAVSCSWDSAGQVTHVQTHMELSGSLIFTTFCFLTLFNSTHGDGQHVTRFNYHSTHLENEASHHASLGKMRILLIQYKITWNPVWVLVIRLSRRETGLNSPSD